MKKRSISVLICASVSATQAFGAGFEKTITWSGKYAGMGGAAVSSVEGAESLYFNPAGLSSTRGTEVSVNISPTFGQYTGPITTNNSSVESSRKVAPVFGTMVGYSVNENLGIGLGAYASGGTKAIFEGVNMGTFNTLNPNISSDLSIMEMALGAGYTIMPGLRLGAAWRVSMVRASLDSVQMVSATRMMAYELSGLSATKYNGFKLGAQYTNADNTWGLGASYRNAIDFTATGTSSVRDEGATSDTAAGTGGDASVSSTFPTQISLAGFFDIMPKKLRLSGEYVWSEYSKNEVLGISGTGTLSDGTTAFNLSSINLNWQNQTNVRVGVEYAALEDWAFRAGYVYTSQVTPAGSARATFASPGPASTVTFGMGTSFMERKLDMNLALEYSVASGTVDADNSPASTATAGSRLGDYKTNAFAFHTGLNYHL